MYHKLFVVNNIKSNAIKLYVTDIFVFLQSQGRHVYEILLSSSYHAVYNQHFHQGPHKAKTIKETNWDLDVWCALKKEESGNITETIRTLSKGTERRPSPPTVQRQCGVIICTGLIALYKKKRIQILGNYQAISLSCFFMWDRIALLIN